MSVKFSAPWKKFLFLYRLAIFSPSSTRKLYGRELYFCALFRFRKIICANCVPIQLKTLARFRSYPVKTIIRKIRRPSVPLRFLGSLRRYSWFPLPRKKSSPLCLLRTLAPHAQNFALCPTEKVFPLRFVLPFRCTPDVQTLRRFNRSVFPFSARRCPPFRTNFVRAQVRPTPSVWNLQKIPS